MMYRDVQACGGLKMRRGVAMNVRGVAILLAGFGLATAAGVTIADTAPARARPAPPDTLPVARVSVAQAMAATTGADMLLVDVRPTGQRKLGHIRGDVHAPIDQFSIAQAKLPRNRRLVMYCACPAEEEALDAARVLLRAGDAQVAVLVGGYDAWRAAGGPTQVDATWEEIFRVDAPPAGWGKTPVDTMRCGYALDDSVAVRGRASARITCRPDTTARGFAGYTQRLDARALKGRPVSLTAMVRADKIERGAFLWIGAEDAEGRFMRVTRPDQDMIVGTQDWRASIVNGVVPPNAVRVLIGISVVTSGRVWMDDVRLVAPAATGLSYLRVVVENPSFEE
jgi:rhodanese-related sulfurtransferase